MSHEKFSVRKRLKSFGYAFNGFKVMLREEHNARIHLVVAVLAVALGIILRISRPEWIFIAIVTGAVFTAELFNSAIENLCDHLSPEKNSSIKKIKDLSAAAVLVTAIVAVVTGCLIFLPRIFG